MLTHFARFVILKDMNKCTVCKKNIKPTGKPGRPSSTHSKCKKSGTKRTKKGSVRRHGSGTTTRSQKGRSFSGVGSGWVTLWCGSRTKGTLHDKTWSVKVVKKGSGCAVVTRHGRRTGQKNESTRKVTNCLSAIKEANRLVRSKLRKGYILVTRLRKRGKRGKRRA